MGPEKLRKAIRIGVIAVLIGLALLDFLSGVTGAEKDVPFEKWYGNWPVVLTTSFFFVLFVFFLTRPRRPKEWKGAGLTAAFFISLFTEMFGIPLTIYLVAPLLGVEPEIFGMYESHLWAYFVSRTGLIDLQTGVHLVMFVSTTLLVLGLSLVALGWKRVYRGQGELVTTGLYAKLRHPQYLGLIIIVIAFLIMWPTVLTILLAPFLIVKYFFLAKEEDRELEQKFRDEFTRYRDTVPAFIPSLGKKIVTTLVASSLLFISGIFQAQTVEETLAALEKNPRSIAGRPLRPWQKDPTLLRE
jgi:protein-S-isoprenylcysteine O-methyltransferase Ste14